MGCKVKGEVRPLRGVGGLVARTVVEFTVKGRCSDETGRHKLKRTKGEVS